MSSDNKNNQSKGPNLVDILLYLLSKWPWYVLSLVVWVIFIFLYLLWPVL